MDLVAKKTNVTAALRETETQMQQAQLQLQGWQARLLGLQGQITLLDELIAGEKPLVD